MNSSPRTLRCAIYTRKSSEEGLDMAFNSLDAQREACGDFIRSQRHQGWAAIERRYDDGGYSGGTTDRPGLQNLLADIRAGRVDTVVVYKVDRLSRLLADFAKLMELFDAHHVSFVSVTQQFNTTTSMGRLTLNMLLSFAQFEREVAGERIRDKLAATFKKGIFVTGQPPLGHRRPREGEPGSAERTLLVVPEEAAVVRAIYAGYLEHGSLVTLAHVINAAGHRTKSWTSSRGRVIGGGPFSATLLYRILTNPIYIGQISHTRRQPGGGGERGGFVTELYSAKHEPIIDQRTWDQVQERMARSARSAATRWTHTHLLKGKIRTFEGHAMSPSTSRRPVAGTSEKRAVRFYVSQKAMKLGYAQCPIKMVRAQLVDDLVRSLVIEHIRIAHRFDLGPLEATLRDRWIREVITAVVIAPELVTITLCDERISTCEQAVRETSTSATRTSRPTIPSEAPPTCLLKPSIERGGGRTVMTLAVNIKRFDGRRQMLSPDGRALVLPGERSDQPRLRPHIQLAIGRAFWWRSRLARPGCTVETLAREQGVSATRVMELLTRTSLSPAILRQALNGSLAPATTLNELISAATVLDWTRQAQRLGLALAR